MIHPETLIYDIETATPEGSPNPEVDIFKVFGAYSFRTNKYYFLTNIEEVKKILRYHKYLVGFNNQGRFDNPGYDNTVLRRFGVSFKDKIIIDLREIFLKRAGVMKTEKGFLGSLIMSFSLDFISRIIGVADDETGKLKFDYKVLNKRSWTRDEWLYIKEYTKRDIEVTKRMYEWVEDYFDVFKGYLHQVDIDNKQYLNSTIAKFVYKTICKQLGWDEAYDTDGESGDKISGGYVAYPAAKVTKGNLYCLDYSSLYPHIMIQCNIFGRVKQPGFNDVTWNGGTLWKPNGTYYADKMSPVSAFFQQIYNERLIFKKENNPKEYTNKIILNTGYGVLNNPYYVNVFDKVAGNDVTTLGRQWTMYARTVFRKLGYGIVYSDTDSVYIEDPYDDEKRMLGVRDKIIADIKSSVPFPVDTFDMTIDDRIKYMFFFKGKKKDDEEDAVMDEDDYKNKKLGLMKKNYIYVTQEGKVKIKNLGVVKKSASPIAKKVFWEVLVPRIKEGQIEFKHSIIKDKVKEFLKADIKLAASRYSVKNVRYYASPTCIQAQIASRYGPGRHFLLPNLKNIGVGKMVKKCSVEEFENANGTVDDLDLSGIFSELEYFMRENNFATVFDYA